MKKLAIILFAFCSLFVSCNQNQAEENRILLKATGIYDLKIAEPSGLAFAGNGMLYCVSDNSGKIYLINTKGETIETLSFTGSDLEAVAIDAQNQEIFVASEKLPTISKITLSGELIESHIVELTYTDKNSGIEGLTINTSSGTLLALNEKNPGLILEYDAAFNLIRKITLDIASDYSDICYFESRQELWILSDEQQKIMRCDLNGNLLEEYVINVYQPEGLAIDEQNGIIYIASDSSEKLYKYHLPELN